MTNDNCIPQPENRQENNLTELINSLTFMERYTLLRRSRRRLVTISMFNPVSIPLIEKGIIYPGGFAVEAHDFAYKLTPLGIQVRDALQRTDAVHPAPDADGGGNHG